MRELTAAYTPFPNLGIRVEPFLLREVRDRAGKTLYAHELEQKRVADADATYILHTLLRGVVQRGTASRLKRYGLGYVAGKTGTTSDYRDAWFVGYTPDMVTSVWVGFDHGAPLRLSSGEAAIPIWGAYMSAIPHLHGEPRPPKGVTFRDIDPETGMLWQDGCPGPIREVFLDGTAPTHKCPAGFFGSIVRRVFFDRDNFDEPAAITFEQFRKWANEVDRSRQEVEGALGPAANESSAASGGPHVRAPERAFRSLLHQVRPVTVRLNDRPARTSESSRSRCRWRRRRSPRSRPIAKCAMTRRPLSATPACSDY